MDTPYNSSIDSEETDNLYSLRKLKDRAQEWFEFFKDNIEYFKSSRNFIFNSIFTNQENSNSSAVGFPQLSFNIVESYHSKFLGNFSKSQPGLEVNANPDGRPVNPTLIDFLDAHLNYRLQEFHTGGDGFKVIEEALSGGWSSVKVYNDYCNNFSMKQDIFVKKCWDTLLTGYDPMSRDEHKGDGEYSFDITYYTEEQFFEMFPDLKENKNKYMSEFIYGDQLRWSYHNQGITLIGVCRMYIKKKKKFRLVELSKVPNAKLQYQTTMPETEYNSLLEEWALADTILPPPKVLHRRTSHKEYVCMYEFTEKEILKKTDMDYEHLPHVFFDGNSRELVSAGGSNTRYQKVRSFTHNAHSAQKAKDITGRALVFHVENIDYTRYLMPVEALPSPPDMMDGWVKNQVTFVKFYQSILKTETGVEQVPMPTKLMDFPFPSEMAQLFAGWDQIMQNVMGAFDANLTQSNNELSGRAIEIAQLESNAVSMPYIVNYLTSLGQVAKIMMALIPVYMKEHRLLPVLNDDNERSMQEVNGPSSLKLNYSSNDIDVVVKAGSNFDLQKNQALQVLGSLAQQFPFLGQVINSKGVNLILENVDMKGIEKLQSIVSEAQEQQENAPPPPPPPEQEKIMSDIKLSGEKLQLEQEKFQHMKQKDSLDLQLQSAEVEIKRLQTELERTKALAEIGIAHGKLRSEGIKDRIEIENTRINEEGKNAEIALRTVEGMQHHQRESAKINNEVARLNKAENKDNGNDETI